MSEQLLPNPPHAPHTAESLLPFQQVLAIAHNPVYLFMQLGVRVMGARLWQPGAYYNVLNGVQSDPVLYDFVEEPTNFAHYLHKVARPRGLMQRHQNAEWSTTAEARALEPVVGALALWQVDHPQLPLRRLLGVQHGDPAHWPSAHTVDQSPPVQRILLLDALITSPDSSMRQLATLLGQEGTIKYWAELIKKLVRHGVLDWTGPQKSNQYEPRRYSLKPDYQPSVQRLIGALYGLTDSRYAHRVNEASDRLLLFPHACRALLLPSIVRQPKPGLAAPVPPLPVEALRHTKPLPEWLTQVVAKLYNPQQSIKMMILVKELVNARIVTIDTLPSVDDPDQAALPNDVIARIRQYRLFDAMTGQYVYFNPDLVAKMPAALRVLAYACDLEQLLYGESTPSESIAPRLPEQMRGLPQPVLAKRLIQLARQQLQA